MADRVVVNGEMIEITAKNKGQGLGVSRATVEDGGAVVLTANRTLTKEDHGKTFISGAADLVVTLPPTSAGLRFRFVTQTTSPTTGYSVSPDAADQIQGNGFTAADNKDAINTAAGDAQGDTIELIGDGAAGWLITGVVGTWAREA